MLALFLSCVAVAKLNLEKKSLASNRFLGRSFFLFARFPPPKRSSYVRECCRAWGSAWNRGARIRNEGGGELVVCCCARGFDSRANVQQLSRPRPKRRLQAEPHCSRALFLSLFLKLFLSLFLSLFLKLFLSLFLSFPSPSLSTHRAPLFPPLPPDYRKTEI